MNPQVLELVKALQAGPYDGQALAVIRAKLTGARAALLGEDNEMLTDLVGMLEDWAEKAGGIPGAAGFYEAAVVLEEDLDDRERAEALYTVCLDLDPTNLDALERLELLLGARGERDRLEAIVAGQAAELERLPDVDPAVASRVFALLGRLRTEQSGDIDRGIEAYERALEMEPDLDIIGELAGLYAMRAGEGDAEQAADLYYTLGDVLGDPEGISALEQALDLVPAHEQALDLLETFIPLNEQATRLCARWAGYLAQRPEGQGADTRRMSLVRAYMAKSMHREALEAVHPLADKGDDTARFIRENLLERLGEKLPTPPPRSGETIVGFRVPESAASKLLTRQALAGEVPSDDAPTVVAPIPGQRPAAQDPEASKPTPVDQAAAPKAAPPAGVRAALAAAPKTSTVPFEVPVPKLAVGVPSVAAQSRGGAPESAGAGGTVPYAVATPAGPGSKAIPSGAAAVAAMAAQASGSTPPSAKSPFNQTVPMPASPALGTDKPALIDVAPPGQEAPGAGTAVATFKAPATAGGDVAATGQGPGSEDQPSPLEGADSVSPVAVSVAPTAAAVAAASRLSPRAWAVAAAAAALAFAAGAWLLIPGGDEPTAAAAAAPATPPTPQPVAAKAPEPERPEPVAAVQAKPAEDPPTAKPAERRGAGRSRPAVQLLGAKLKVRRGKINKPRTIKAANKSLPKLKRCYASALSRRPKMHGRLTFTLTVKRNGKVASARPAKAGPKDKRLRACSARALKATRFPRPKTKTAKVSAAFEFKRR